MEFQRKKPAAIGTKPNYPGFIEPGLASSDRRIQRVSAGSSRSSSALWFVSIRWHRRFVRAVKPAERPVHQNMVASDLRTRSFGRAQAAAE